MKKNERSGEQPREDSELQQPKVKIELTGDMEPVIEEALQDMTQEQKREIAKAAKALTGEKPESVLEGAQILYEEFAKPQTNPKIEEAFDQIEQDALEATNTPEVQQAKKATDKALIEAVLSKLSESEETETSKALAAKLQTQLAEITEEITEEGIDLHLADIITTDPVEYLGAGAQRMGEMTKKILEKLSTFINSGEMQLIKERLHAVSQFLENHREDIERLAGTAQEMLELQPLISEIYDEISEQEQYQQMTLDELLKDRTDANGNRLPPLFSELIERARQRRGILPQPVRPNSLLYMTSALGRYLREGYKKPLINGGPVDLPMPLRGAADMEIYFAISDTANPAAQPYNLTMDEETLLSAAFSVWKYAEDHNVSPTFTNDTIYELLPGEGRRASDARSKEMDRTWKRLESERIEIDATNEMRARNLIGDDDNWHFSEMALYLLTGYGTIAGKEMVTYTITRKPIILQYLEATGQYGSIKASLLKIRKTTRPEKNVSKTWGIGAAVSMNAERQGIVIYLAKRIGIMRNDIARATESAKTYNTRHKDEPQKSIGEYRKTQDVILLDAVLKEIDTPLHDRGKRQAVREFCLQVLDFWEAKKHIAGYKLQKKGRLITGIKIIHEYQQDPRK